jgi:hypothetical protein
MRVQLISTVKLLMPDMDSKLQRTSDLEDSFLYNRLRDDPETTVNLNLFESEMKLMWEHGRRFGIHESYDIVEKR